MNIVRTSPTIKTTSPTSNIISNRTPVNNGSINPPRDYNFVGWVNDGKNNPYNEYESDGLKYVQTNTDEYVPVEDYLKIDDPELQQMLINLGSESYNVEIDRRKAEFEASHTKLDDGTYVTNEEFNNLSPEDQILLKTLGIGEFNTAKKLEYDKIVTTSQKSLSGEEAFLQLQAKGEIPTNAIYTGYDGSTGNVSYSVPPENSIKLLSDEYVSKEYWDTLTESGQTALSISGVNKFNLVSNEHSEYFKSGVTPVEQKLALDTVMANGWATLNDDGTYNLKLVSNGWLVSIDYLKKAFPDLSPSQIDELEAGHQTVQTTWMENAKAVLNNALIKPYVIEGTDKIDLVKAIQGGISETTLMALQIPEGEIAKANSIISGVGVVDENGNPLVKLADEKFIDENTFKGLPLEIQAEGLRVGGGIDALNQAIKDAQQTTGFKKATVSDPKKIVVGSTISEEDGSTVYLTIDLDKIVENEGLLGGFLSGSAVNIPDDFYGFTGNYIWVLKDGTITGDGMSIQSKDDISKYGALYVNKNGTLSAITFDNYGELSDYTNKVMTGNIGALGESINKFVTAIGSKEAQLVTMGVFSEALPAVNLAVSLIPRGIQAGAMLGMSGLSGYGTYQLIKEGAPLYEIVEGIGFTVLPLIGAGVMVLPKITLRFPQIKVKGQTIKPTTAKSVVDSLKANAAAEGKVMTEYESATLNKTLIKIQEAIRMGDRNTLIKSAVELENHPLAQGSILGAKDLQRYALSIKADPDVFISLAKESPNISATDVVNRLKIFKDVEGKVAENIETYGLKYKRPVMADVSRYQSEVNTVKQAIDRTGVPSAEYNTLKQMGTLPKEEIGTLRTPKEINMSKYSAIRGELSNTSSYKAWEYEYNRLLAERRLLYENSVDLQLKYANFDAYILNNPIELVPYRVFSGEAIATPLEYEFYKAKGSLEVARDTINRMQNTVDVYGFKSAVDTFGFEQVKLVYPKLTQNTIKAETAIFDAIAKSRLPFKEELAYREYVGVPEKAESTMTTETFKAIESGKIPTEPSYGGKITPKPNVEEMIGWRKGNTPPELAAKMAKELQEIRLDHKGGDFVYIFKDGSVKYGTDPTLMAQIVKLKEIPIIRSEDPIGALFSDLNGRVKNRLYVELDNKYIPEEYLRNLPRQETTVSKEFLDSLGGRLGDVYLTEYDNAVSSRQMESFLQKWFKGSYDSKPVIVEVEGLTPQEQAINLAKEITDFQNKNGIIATLYKYGYNLTHAVYPYAFEYALADYGGGSTFKGFTPSTPITPTATMPTGTSVSNSLATELKAQGVVVPTEVIDTAGSSNPSELTNSLINFKVQPTMVGAPVESSIITPTPAIATVTTPTAVPTTMPTIEPAATPDIAPIPTITPESMPITSPVNVPTPVSVPVTTPAPVTDTSPVIPPSTPIPIAVSTPTPTPTPTPTSVVTPTPAITPIPTIPITPIIKPFKQGRGGLPFTVAPAGTVLWRQGLYWVIVPPPYDTEYHSKKPPLGTKKFATGKGSAYKTLDVIGGMPSEDINIDLGWADVSIVKDRFSGKLRMSFKGGKEAIEKRWDEYDKMSDYEKYSYENPPEEDMEVKIPRSRRVRERITNPLTEESINTPTKRQSRRRRMVLPEKKNGIVDRYYLNHKLEDRISL